MIKYVYKKINKNILFILLIIIFTHLTDLYYNIYAVFIRGYEERMIRAYGDCERESYGFVKKAYNLTKSQNLKIINFEGHLYPNINGLFSIVKKPVDENYLVLLNLKNLDQKIDKNNDLIIDKNLKLNLDNKNIILKDANCYLIKK
jgi:hypothetical protein